MEERNITHTGKVLKFTRGAADTVPVPSIEELEYELRMERIQASLARINVLMEKLNERVNSKDTSSPE